MNIKKGIPIVILILSAAVFLLLTAASSPYRELRPYRFFGRTGPEKIGLNTMMVNGRLAVMISGTEDTEPFYIDQIPVTVGAYKKCTALGSCQTQHYRNYYTQFYAGNIFILQKYIIKPYIKCNYFYIPCKQLINKLFAYKSACTCYYRLVHFKLQSIP